MVATSNARRRSSGNAATEYARFRRAPTPRSPASQEQCRRAKVHTRPADHVETARSEASIRLSASDVSRPSWIVTLQRPSASGWTIQCGWTTTDWCTSSKPPSDWLTVSTGKVQKPLGREIFRLHVDPQPLVDQAQARPRRPDRAACPVGPAVRDRRRRSSGRRRRPAGRRSSTRRRNASGSPGRALQQIGNRQAGAAGVERQALGDPHRQIAGVALRGQLHLDAVGIAAEAGFVLAGQKVAPLGRLRRGPRRPAKLAWS